MQRFWAIFALGFLLTLSAHAAGIREGMSQAEVEAALGKPTAALRRDDRLILTYPKGGRVELADDKVVEMQNVALALTTDEAAAEEYAKSLPQPTATPTPSPAPPPKPTAQPRRPSYMSAQETESDRAKGVEMLIFAVVALFRVAAMIVVLKLAFRWVDVHAEWGQMIIPAISDTAVRGMIALIGLKIMRLPSMFYIDELLAFFALLFVLVKTTHACTFSRAVQVALAAKAAGIAVSILIGMAVVAVLAS